MFHDFVETFKKVVVVIHILYSFASLFETITCQAPATMNENPSCESHYCQFLAVTIGAFPNAALKLPVSIFFFLLSHSLLFFTPVARFWTFLGQKQHR